MAENFGYLAGELEALGRQDLARRAESLAQECKTAGIYSLEQPAFERDVVEKPVPPPKSPKLERKVPNRRSKSEREVRLLDEKYILEIAKALTIPPEETAGKVKSELLQLAAQRINKIVGADLPDDTLLESLRISPSYLRNRYSTEVQKEVKKADPFLRKHFTYPLSWLIRRGYKTVGEARKTDSYIKPARRKLGGDSVLFMMEALRKRPNTPLEDDITL